ncbi:PREDICTED: coadhesin-like isoform X2 [Acropora digitifera]|uniref:coadhesin-like isoform X2 n=2 Tax=Acropora digitifera TaxID=70779 RepID=UPI00077ACF92|nr:PREDICTED: coadhesin-like isoform X2 [Acropora digitifera]
MRRCGRYSLKGTLNSMIFLMIFLAVPVGKQVEAYRQGPGCGALLTQDIVSYTIIVTGSLNSSFDETHALLNSSNGWCSSALDPNQYLVVELGKVATITGFDIQGRSSSNQYIKEFTLSYKAAKYMLFQDYSEFTASPSSGDEIKHFQVNATDMQIVGFYPSTFKDHICMRVELYGCVPVDGGYTPWSAWNSCSNLCGNGTQRRHRECSNPAPANNGQSCVGNSTETRGCVNRRCPEWSEWTSCSVTCGNGSQSRSRNCTNLRPIDGVKSCKEYRTCQLEQCEVRANSSSSSMEGDQRKHKFFILMVVLAAALPVVIVT